MPDYIGDCGDEAEGELRRVYRSVPRFVFYVAAYMPGTSRRLKPKRRRIKGFDEHTARRDLLNGYHRRGLFVRYIEPYGVAR